MIIWLEDGSWKVNTHPPSKFVCNSADKPTNKQGRVRVCVCVCVCACVRVCVCDIWKTD